MDLLEIFQEEPPFSPRYILNLIHHLPTTSATFAALRGGIQFRGWDEDRYLQVAQADALRGLLYAFILAHAGKNARKPHAPEPWPTPERRDRRERERNTPGSFTHMVAMQIAQKRKKKGGG